MLDANNLVELIKRASQDAYWAAEPCDFCYGKVTSVSPLKILIDQKIELTAAQLVLTRNVTDFKTTVTLSGDNSAAGTYTMTVNNALAKGDKVVLIQKQGGQKYLVTDRVVSI